ncbi:MAG: mercury(II) reductase [Candidatus Paracaedimonas acanthamoebae]|uniref:Mercuric reductase n=1 Tax=Candidatus Paracaedimonas acanthamoebae TaxID=244581 RepID=A0A8J7TVE3_9PROT|nr:mercury(II) reductase [Candidatus Paracaedimonas acanthamoebae]
MNKPSFLKSVIAAAAALFLNINPLLASITDEDIAIIGSGSAAFSAAIHLASRGAKVTMIEEKTVGGTCVNVGCVPSKILIRSGQIAHMQEDHPFKGIQKNQPTIQNKLVFDQLQDRVLELRKTKYEDILLQNPKIKFIQGTARLIGSNKVLVHIPEKDPLELNPTKILLTTGSSPTIPDIEGLNKTPYWTSTEALFSGIVPKHLIVLGGSFVAVELAQAFSHLGSKVTLLARSTLLSREDPDISKELKGIFEGEGIRVLTHTLPKSVEHKEDFFHINIGEETLFGDHLLVATGRHANSKNLGLGEVGVKLDSEGRILVDEYLRTSVKNIFSAGDCTQLPQYVYVAAAAGNKAAINMLSEHTGVESPLDLSVVPAVTFTDPQVATVGLSAKQAKEQGYEVETRTLTLDNVPRALANFDTRGFIKLVADKKTKLILGSQIVASEAGDVIQSAALAIHNKMTTDELASKLFPYLTMVEGLKLCAQTFFTDVKKLSCCSAHIEDISSSKL